MNRKITSFLIFFLSLTINLSYFNLGLLNNNSNFVIGANEVRAATIPSDSHYKNQWYLEKIRAPIAWDKFNSSPHVIIAIIDSGIQINHEDLADNIWINQDEIPNNGIDDDGNGFIDDINGWDFVKNIADPNPKFEEGFTEGGVLHGTIVAGIAAGVGNNKKGIAGVTWSAQIMPLRVLNDKGEGNTGDVIRAIDYAIANGADIINLSFMGFEYSQGLEEAIRRAYQAGIAVVAAAGNEQGEGSGYNLDETPMYPACHDGSFGENMVIGVAATDAIDQKAHFSSYGHNCVDITAPGISFFSTSVYNPSKSIDGKIFSKKYDGYWSGTSMATPIVSGAIALIKGINPNLTLQEVKNYLLSNADNINKLNPGYEDMLGVGRINLEKIVDDVYKDINSINNNLLIAPFSEKESKVKIVDYKGYNQNEFFVYNESFRGGVNVASGDLDGDGKDEIITGAGPGGGPHVRIFNSNGKVIGQFFAYNESFRGGVNVAVDNVFLSGRSRQNEIIVAPASNFYPEIKIFNNHGKELNKIIAYNNNFLGGVNITTGDLDNDGVSEIITGASKTGGPHVRVFKFSGELLSGFYAYDVNFSGGVNVGVFTK